ncbi:MAG: FAD-binding oxidoreductase [Thermales bacterium]|nr:FAD-binding oxidoreductase [Thermales bacterium]
MEQIQETVQLAKDEKKKISMSGARHSMGGQNAFDNSIHLDMREFNNIQYNQEDQTVTVQSGATWKSIQNKLSKHNRSVQVMQDSNIFTVGGSIAVNAHGKDPNFSTLIHTVNEFQLVNAEGELITCSRTENPELFYAVHGGMGLFGVVTQVTLNTNPNNIYQTKLELFDSKDFLHNMEQSSADSELSEAHFSMDQDNLLKEVLVYNYKPTNTTKDVEDDITGENSIWLRKAIYRLA